jgi:hypothetical protein
MGQLGVKPLDMANHFEDSLIIEILLKSGAED